jgi:hypothetical protein
MRNVSSSALEKCREGILSGDFSREDYVRLWCCVCENVCKIFMIACTKWHRESKGPGQDTSKSKTADKCCHDAEDLYYAAPAFLTLTPLECVAYSYLYLQKTCGIPHIPNSPRRC